MKALSVLAALGALFGVFIACVTLLLAGGDGGVAYDYDPATIYGQLALAMLGLTAAGAMVYFSFSERTRAAIVLLALGLLIWAGWAVLNDAAVHGWGDDMVLARVFS